MTSPVAGPSFSSATAAVYIFNLIVGTGALALPRAFQEAGSVQCTAVQCSANFSTDLQKQQVHTTIKKI